MPQRLALSAGGWAETQFGSTALGDARRTRRAVQIAAAMQRQPQASLPQQLGSRAALRACYRLLDEADVTHAALMTPHWQHTRAAAGDHPVVLLVQDTTELNYTHHPKPTGLGPVGDGVGRGLLLQTVLAVVPQPRTVLGIAYDEPFLRTPAPVGETRSQRRARPREADVWQRAVEAIGSVPAGSRWVHVGDRYSDIFRFLVACRTQGGDFLIRAAQDRGLLVAGVRQRLFAWARQLPALDTGRSVVVRQRGGRPQREAQVMVGAAAATLLPPVDEPAHPALAVWVVRVWEPAPPPDVPALEWVLLTSVPTDTAAAAWERVTWYRWRWLAEDYHQCLKTGCAIEQRQVQDGARLQRLLGLCAPQAVRLLQLRETAQQAPEEAATAVLEPRLVHLVAWRSGQPATALSVRGFWRAVAQVGGFLGRPRDGAPGWQTLWRGWHEIQLLYEGLHLADHLPP